MKKISLLAIIATLSFSTSVFATTLTSGQVSQQGKSITGGSSQAIADAATSPMVRFSTGVMGLVNFPAPDANNLVSSYVLATKHYKGSKIFGTANDSTSRIVAMSFCEPRS